ncbi:MAG: type III secretion system export apparatus subunit SctV [Candidatus Schekmanbacteria bacterium]|nr:type III secretion system export apparatus subunit SctV [Candidatus Schekmanbacteria bacterium]
MALDFADLQRRFFRGELVDFITRYSDIFLAGLIIVIIGMMIVPLPPLILDLLLATNITASVVILMTCLYIPNATKIASFPSILLITTLFRLALNVSSTRLILLYAYAGEVIKGFGEFVVGGNMVVGAIIFIVLILVQMLVITKGAERVSEVAARFTLDAMPGKQMSIDADVRAGSITMEEAAQKRTALAMESKLFGNMDGAMKFVKGDAIAGIIMTAINIIGGLIIGVMMKGMTAGEAAKTYSILTIGDGLVSQIPSLLISVSAGFIVTRVASEDEGSHLGKDIGTQILGQPKAIAIASGFLILIGLIPGLPTVPFFVLSALAGSMAFSVFKMREVKELEAQGIHPGAAAAPAPAQPGEKGEVVPQKRPAAAPAKKAGPKEDRGLTFVVPVALEVSRKLTPLVDANQDGGEFLNEMIPAMRDILYMDMGVKFPGVRIRGNNPNLAPDTYLVKLHEIPIATGQVPDGKILVREAAENLRNLHIQAMTTRNPSDGTPAAWVDSERIPIIEQAGLMYWQPPGVMLLHLSGVLRHYAAEFLGIQEVQSMLDEMEKTYPALVKAVVPKIITVIKLTEILQRLVEEDISIRDLRRILEALAEWGQVEKDTVMLTEYVRSEMKRYISFKAAGGGTVLYVYLLDPQIEDMVKNSLRHTASGSYVALEPELTQELFRAMRRQLGTEIHTAQIPPVILTAIDIRPYFRRLIELEFPRLSVLSYQELTEEMNVQPLGRIALDG